MLSLASKSCSKQTNVRVFAFLIAKSSSLMIMSVLIGLSNIFSILLTVYDLFVFNV